MIRPFGSSESSGSSETLASTVTLTAADLADLHNTPVELVAAPGAGKAVILCSASSALALGGGHAYASGGGYPGDVFYGGTSTGPADYSGDFNQGFADAVEDLVSHSTMFSRQAMATADISGAALNLSAASPILVPGAIVTSAIAAAGTGYVALETVTRGDATIRIDTVDGGGEVLTYTVTVAGTNNVIGTAQATTGGSGADFTIDITELDYSVNPMTLTIKTLYSVMDV